MSIPFKPRKSTERAILKNLKDDFDLENPRLDAEENFLEWAARHPTTRAMQSYSGEFLHQLGLRCERRSEIDRALKLYAASEDQLKGNPLGLARTLRDHGMCLIENGAEPSEGLALIEQALTLHEEDVDNEKGQRQAWITMTKLWRAQILLGGPDAVEAEKNLVALVLDDSHFNFHVRDRKVIIDFLLPRSRGEVRRQLLMQKAAVHAERRQPGHVIVSCTKLFIDIQLSIAAAAIRSVFRKE